MVAPNLTVIMTCGAQALVRSIFTEIAVDQTSFGWARTTFTQFTTVRWCQVCKLWSRTIDQAQAPDKPDVPLTNRMEVTLLVHEWCVDT
jgi:hypothetical protein